MKTSTSFSDSLTSATLRFDRSGRHLIAAEPDAITIVALELGLTTRLPISDARSVAGFDDELWIVTHEDRLVRVDHAGNPLGEPVVLPFAARATLQPAPCGAAAAIWSSVPRVVVAAAATGTALALTELPEGADVTIPLTARRFLTARGARLTLPSGVVTQLAPNTRVLDGLVLQDGKTVTLLVTQTGTRQLVVVSLGTGHVVHRCAAPSSTVRVASGRGIVVVQLEPRRLWAIDLAAGRELGSIALDRDVTDYAINPTGTTLALRDAAGDLELCELGELMDRGRQVVVAEVIEDVIEDVPEAPAADVPEVATVDIAFASHTGEPVAVAGPATFTCPALLALEPRQRAPIDAEEARDELARELRSVALWTTRAIAEAWDTRRLGYGNEGRHPFELEVGALLGLNAGFASEYVTAAAERIASHEAELARDPRRRSATTPIGALRAELGLSDRAIDVVMVIAAAALLGETARLFGILTNDAGRAVVDELLVQQVLGAHHLRHEVAAELDPRAPLMRLGIVQTSTRRARPFAELSIDPVVLDRLRAVVPDLGVATTIRSESGLSGSLPALDLPPGVLDEACLALARPVARGARIVVRGRIGCGRRTLLAALAQAAGRELAVIDALALPRTADAFVTELGHCLRRSHLAGLVPCVIQLDEVTFDDRAGRDIATEVLRLHPGPIALVAAPDGEVPFAAGHIAIEIPVLPETARRAVWERALLEAGLVATEADAIAARYKVGPGVIRSAVAAARRSLTDDTADPRVAIDAYIRQTRDARLGQYAKRVTRLASWSSIVLPPDILDSLRELIARVRHGKTVFETWGMQRAMSTSRGLTALFQGQPGTGKTLVAGLIARELGLDLYQVDLSKVMSKWIGETERNLSTIFDAAEDGQVVLLFDEADSLFAKRTEVRSSNDRYANLEVNYLLQRLDSFGGIAVLTTNIGRSIDQAFKRRMSFRLSFPFPDEDTREQLWRAHLPPELPITGTLALDVLARKYQLSGGYIRNACLRAAFLAAQESTSLHQRHLERAVTLEYAEMGLLSNSGPID